MGKDYYSLLGISKDADEDAIKQAYKKQALKWHPDRHQNDKDTATAKFKEVSEAYEALSDKERRTIYDKYGEEGLKNGAPPQDGNFSGFSGFPGAGGSTFTSFGGGMPGGAHFQPSNAEFVFDSFFKNFNGPSGGFSSFSDDFGSFPNFSQQSKFGGAGFGEKYRPASQAPRIQTAIQRSLPVALEDLYKGTVKKLKITRQLVDSVTGNTKPSEQIYSINVLPGWKAGTNITFSAAGEALPEGGFQDVVFTVEEKPHPVFKRENDNLSMVMSLTLAEALCGFSKEITTLDDRKIIASESIVVNPGQERRIPHEGMPIRKKPGKKGDLIIKYLVNFPKSLTFAQKQSIKQALGA